MQTTQHGEVALVVVIQLCEQSDKHLLKTDTNQSNLKTLGQYTLLYSTYSPVHNPISTDEANTRGFELHS